MKLSKAGKNGWHNRSGVKVKDEKQEGFIYSVPHSTDNENTSEIIKKRIQDAQGMYVVFSPLDKKKESPSECKNLIKEFNICIKNCKKEIFNIDYKEEEDWDLKLPKLKKSRDLLREKLIDSRFFPKEIKRKTAEYTVNNALRHSLCRGNVKTDLVNFICGLEAGFSEADTGLEFLEEMVKDYLGKKIHYKAVLNQNLVVQPVSTGENAEKVLTISKKDYSIKERKDYKSNEDKALRAFLSGYAVLDDNTRKDIRLRLRRLVILYFYGIDEVKKTTSDSFDEWNDHEERRGDNAWFIGYNWEERKDVSEDTVRNDIRQANINAFLSSKEFLGTMQESDENLFFKEIECNMFWIRHMSKEVERLTQKVSKKKTYRLTKGYLSEKTWKGMINYLSIKYIAIGKAVFNFATTGFDDGECLISGDLLSSYEQGISSFELEKIKAEETLTRETAVKVGFAARNLLSAVIRPDSKDSDLLTLSEDEICNNLRDRDRLLQDIFQFFGGYSEWSEYLEQKEKENPGYAVRLLNSMKECIYSLRNESFHFMTLNKEVKWDTELISGLFEHDCAQMVALDKNAFYSNNLWKFFRQKDLLKLIETIYAKTYDRASQIPAFNTVFKRDKFPSYLLSYGINRQFDSAEEQNQFYSGLYYMFKEIYYNGFIQSPKTKELFFSHVNSVPIKKEKNRNGKPVTKKECIPIEDFKTFTRLHEKSSFAEICQALMTEYNQQNNQGRKKKSAYVSQMHKDKFRHYVDILHEGIRMAFIAYMDMDNADSICYFIKHGDNFTEDDLEKESFLSNYKSGRFSGLKEKVKHNPDLQKWYIVCRMLAPKQVNELAGSVRSYRQYIEDVCSRSIAEGTPIHKKNGIKIRNITEDIKDLLKIDYEGIISIITLCTKLNGRFTKESTDYFRDGEDGYARYLLDYLDYGHESTNGTGCDISLKAFCTNLSEGNTGIIYHDGTNLILNRNILLSKLYGENQAIRESIRKVDESLIRKYLSSSINIADYKKNGDCRTKEEQTALKNFQELKNRVEFVNIMEYNEILNELQGQLLNWSYIRERDLMYFQLGFHYTCLHNGSWKPEGYEVIKTDERPVKNAILHQILALYINGIPLYYWNEDGTSFTSSSRAASCAEKSTNACEITSAKIRHYLNKISRNINNEPCGNEIYLAGLELFENISEHANIMELRNCIDHFHVFKDKNRSILEVYSEVFDRFFTYDLKYSKNAVNMIYNILLSHFIKAEFEFESSKKMVGRKKSGSGSVEKDMALIVIKSLKSDDFTYKVGDKNNKKEIKLPARDTEFIEVLYSILNNTKTEANKT